MEKVKSYFSCEALPALFGKKDDILMLESRFWGGHNGECKSIIQCGHYLSYLNSMPKTGLWISETGLTK